jgi:hypothetical protein
LSGRFTGGRDRLVLKLAFVMIDGVVGVIVFFVAFVARVSTRFGGVSLFVSRFGFDFSALERAEVANFFYRFGLFGSVVGNFDLIDDVDLVHLFLFFLFVLFLVVIVECSTANDRVGRSMRLHFILFRIDDAGSESIDFVFAQRGFGRSLVTRIAAFELVSFLAVRGCRCWALERAFGSLGSGLGFGARTGEQPAWKAGRTARRVGGLRSRAARDRFVDDRLRLVVQLVFDDWRRRSGGCGTRSVFRERLAWQQNFFFAARSLRRRRTRSALGPAIVETSWTATISTVAAIVVAASALIGAVAAIEAAARIATA